MKKYLLRFLTICSLAVASQLHGQGVLISFLNPATNQWEIGSYDLANCSYETVIESVGSPIGDFLLADNGIYYMIGFVPGSNGSGQAGLLTIDPLTGATTLLVIIEPNIALLGSIIQLNATTLIIAHANSFFTYDIPSGTLTQVGMGNLLHVPELFTYQGNVYLKYILPPTNTSWLVQLSFNPFVATPITQLSGVGITVGVCGNVFTIEDYTIFENNMGNNTIDVVCDNIPALEGAYTWFFSFAPDPNNTSGPLCNCTTESGIITPGFYQACGQNPITIPHLGDETLEGDDALVFLLAETGDFDYPNTAADVLHIYDTPVATFIPGVTEVDVVYYVFPAAANAVTPGFIDWDDDCLEIGLPVAIRWTVGPTVAFDLLSLNCTTGCQTVRANFTGTPPFNLTYTVSTASGQTSTFTQTSNGFNLDLTICAPAGYTGALNVQATNLVDAVCTCGP